MSGIFGHTHTCVLTSFLPSLPCVCLRQDDHKLTLDELNRKYGTDLNNVSVTTFTF